jgi:hypothetical protein
MQGAVAHTCIGVSAWSWTHWLLLLCVVARLDAAMCCECMGMDALIIIIIIIIVFLRVPSA